MKKMQWIDLFREIRKSRGRYLSLLFIVALGTAFYAGVRSSEPDMTISADRYYDETELMDIRILGTLGLTEEDVQAVSDTEGILHAEGGYQTEAFAVCQDSQPVISIYSLGKKLNHLTIEEGTLPVSSAECFMDSGFMQDQGYQIGDTVTICDEDGEKPEVLAEKEYVITGYGTWSWYLSWDRGSASIGNGSADAFMIVPEESFDMDCYRVIYALTEGTKELNTFSDLYDEQVEVIAGRLEALADSRCKIRYEALKKEADDAIANAKKEVSDAKKELADAEQELKDGEQEYLDGKAAYEEGLSEYEKGQKEYQDGKKELADAKRTLDANEKKYQDGLTAFADGEKALADAKTQWEEGSLQLADAKKQLLDGQAQLESSEKTLSEQEQELQAGWAACEEGEKSLQAAKDQLSKQEQELLAGEQALLTGKTALEAYEEGSAEYEMQKAALAEMEMALIAGREQFETAQKEVLAKETVLLQNRKQLEQGQQKLLAGKEELSKAKQELIENQKLLTAKEKELLAAKKEIEEGETKLSKERKTLSDARKQLDDGLASYKEGIAELNKAEKELSDAKTELSDAQTELLDARKKLSDGWSEFEEAKEEALPKIADAEKEIADGEESIAKLGSGEWYVLDRDTLQTGVQYGMDAERIGAIGKIFPVIFFLVAALVSLTTMTRMVEEERMLIGTMKALGYGKLAIASKYIVYAGSATLAGGVLGVLAGSKLLPFVIMTAYGMLYTNVGYMLMPLHLSHCLFAVCAALFCTVGAAFAACYRALMSEPAALMRPPAPKQGKRVLFEYVPFIWNRMNFSMKSTIRNLVRYKKRFFMTVFGIGGCMALLLVGFGLRDSIAEIVKKQYKTIWTYSASCGLEEKTPLDEQEAFIEEFKINQPLVTETMLARQVSLDAGSETAEKNVYLYVPQDCEIMKQFVHLHNRLSQEVYELTDEGVIITEKLASILDVEEGDTIYLKVSDTKRQEVKVCGISENYLHYYIYISSKLYEEIYQKAPQYNTLVLNFKENTTKEQEHALSEALLKNEDILSVSLVDELQASVDDMMNALNLVVWVLIIAAGLLAFVVLFNLNNINISERRRELATLKVLGFFDQEVAAYVYRENIFLTIFGTLFGIFMGTWLHRYTILTLEVDMIMFGRNISLSGYLFSILMTLLFSMAVNVSMYYKLRQIDMIESLKSVE